WFTSEPAIHHGVFDMDVCLRWRAGSIGILSSQRPSNITPTRELAHCDHCVCTKTWDLREQSPRGCKLHLLRWLGAFHQQCDQQRRDGILELQRRLHKPPRGPLHARRRGGDQCRAVLAVWPCAAACWPWPPRLWAVSAGRRGTWLRWRGPSSR